MKKKAAEEEKEKEKKRKNYVCLIMADVDATLI